MANMKNKVIIKGFIEEIWNRGRFEKLDTYVHPRFRDHSLIPSLPPDKEGMMKWIQATGGSFEHRTIIEEMVCENDKVMLKVRMHLKHIGKWRGIAATYSEIDASGFRAYRLVGSKIIEHWALIDGQAIERQLSNASDACKVRA